MMTREQAIRQVRQMDLPELIAYWNSKASDHYCRLNEIAKKDDQEWLFRLGGELGSEFMDVLMESINFGHLKQDDEYMMYCEIDHCLVSFSHKRELESIVGYDWFIENLMYSEF